MLVLVFPANLYHAMSSKAQARNLSIHPSICLSIYLSIYLSVYLGICHLSVYRSIYLSIYMSVYLYQARTRIGPPAVYLRLPIQALFAAWARWHVL